MLSLTRQEKSVLLFIALVALFGLGISYLKKAHPRLKALSVSEPLPSRANSRIDLNKAGCEELLPLPGIGPELAQRIIDYRNSYGSFKKIEDIKKVKGIGSAKFEVLKDYLQISENPYFFRAGSGPDYSYPIFCSGDIDWRFDQYPLFCFMVAGVCFNICWIYGASKQHKSFHHPFISQPGLRDAAGPEL